MTPIDDLLVEIFDGRRGPLYAEFAEWLRASRRFQAFAAEYRTKTRAKLRNAQGSEGVKDVRAEVEVRRVRDAELDPGERNALVFKLATAICDKVGQMPPGMLNFLWLTAESDISEFHLGAAGLLLRRAYEEKADAFFAGRGFSDAADFLKQYQRLAGVILSRAAAVMWLNPLARHAPPPEIVRALRRAASEQPENG